jgi:hypothetical protein
MESTKQELLPFHGKMHVASAGRLVQLCPAQGLNLDWRNNESKLGARGTFNLQLCSCAAQRKN